MANLKNQWKSLGINFLILTFTLVALGALFEGVLRLIISPEKEIDKNWVQKFIQYNNDGFRDREFELQKPRGKFRILVVGDSQIFGHGIERLEDTVPKRLENLLNGGKVFPRFEVFNFARPGWNTDSELQYIYKKGLRYKPDLILLNFFHNDLPPSAFFDCDSKDREFLPGNAVLVKLFHSSILYHVLSFRVNRLLEKMGYKPSYEDCRRASYRSRSWNMEEIYLDTILNTTRMKGIHFMISVLPVMFRLGADYPFIFAHKKLAGYCESRDLFCVDLYQDGFQGKNENIFVISEKDRHLNEQGTELTAQVLFEKLKILKTYQNLNRWHNAFDLKELLDPSGMPGQFNLHFNELDVSPVSLKIADEETLAWSDEGNYYILRTKTDPNKKKWTSLKQIILERNGQLVKRERKTFDSTTGNLNLHEITEIINGKILQTIKQHNPNQKEEFVETRGAYVFAYRTNYRKNLDKFIWELEIKENTRFLDPLTLESALFFPKKLRLDQLDRLKLQKSLEFYLKSPFYKKGSGVNYVQKLSDEILRVKPFKEAIDLVNELGEIDKKT